KDTPPPTPIRSPRTHIASLSSDKEKLQDTPPPTPLVEPCRVAIVHTRDHEDHHDDAARPEGESSTQEDLEDFDAWLNKQGIDDDEVPTKEVSPELLVEVSKREMTFNDTQRIQNVVNIMMRDRCNSGEEHQYHLD
ncbi:hypothetical protein Tco_0164902, partial [Tanacetum coccineum]